MCTKKVLYSVGMAEKKPLVVRKKGEKLSFKQVCYTTDCLLAYANRREIPMAEAINELKVKNAFPIIYKAARKSSPDAVRSVVAKIMNVEA